MRRRYPTAPLPAVSAVIINSCGKVLIVKRAHEPGKGKWSIPGGVIRLGEAMVQALQREIREECGLEIQVDRLLTVTDRIVKDGHGKIEYHYILIDYLCEPGGGELSIGSDIGAAQWVSPEELEKFDFTPGVKEVIEQGFKIKTCHRSAEADRSY